VLPGLMADKFGPYLCVQNAGTRNRQIQDVSAELLDEIIEPPGIYERNDLSVRSKEGLPLVTGFFTSLFNTRVAVTENGIPVEVDVAGGNKTGYFLDRRVCVDISADAMAALAKSEEHNGWSDRVAPVTANVFDLLRQYEANGRRFDVIVLDPPGFAKSRSALDRAYRSYKETNLCAFKMLRPGGILESCSCSYHMHEHTFVILKVA